MRGLFWATLISNFLFGCMIFIGFISDKDNNFKKFHLGLALTPITLSILSAGVGLWF